MDIHALKQEITGRLQLADKAGGDANANIPAPDAKTLCGTEQSILAAARTEGQKYLDQFNTQYETTASALNACKKTLNDSHTQRRQAIAVAPPQGNIESIQIVANEATAAYNQFRRDNKISRGASGDDRLAQVLWALVVIIIEGALNSYFFAPASGHGLVGGFTAAFFISIVNIGFAFWGGVLGLRYAKNHCNPLANLGGLIWFVICIFVCATMIAMATLYRGHIELLSEKELTAAQIAAQASKQTMNSLSAFDYNALFNSVDSLILFLAGALCAMIGVWKGYEYDDPYPGFGAMWRQKEDARKRHEDAQTQHNVELREWRQACGGGIREAKDNMDNAGNVLQNEANGMNRMLDNIVNMPDDIAQLANVLLGEYRQINTTIRATPPPPYFADNLITRKDFPLIIDRCDEHYRNARTLKEESDSLLNDCGEEQKEIQNTLNSMP